MRKLVFSAWFITLATRTILAQSIFPSGWTETAVLIQHPAGGGSGFFLQYSNNIFLVTAKHVIPPEQLAHSKTLRGVRDVRSRASVLDYGSAPPP
jgi:hypothetical protein